MFEKLFGGGESKVKGGGVKKALSDLKNEGERIMKKKYRRNLTAEEAKAKLESVSKDDQEWIALMPVINQMYPEANKGLKMLVALKTAGGGKDAVKFAEKLLKKRIKKEGK